jgi:PadR family transcriptional regulator PadR
LIEKRVNEKIVRSFLDLVAMTILNGKPAYGYEIMSVIHEEFGVLLSPGVLYPLLHSLEDEGLIESGKNGGRIVYKTSSKGEQQFERTLNAFNLAVEEMLNFIKEWLRRGGGGRKGREGERESSASLIVSLAGVA